METKEIVEVQFRKLKNEIIAVFPYEIQSKNSVLCYAKIGQHSEAVWYINQFTKSAKPDEYKELFEELKNIGYNLKVIAKRSHKKFLKAFNNK